MTTDMSIDKLKNYLQNTQSNNATLWDILRRPGSSLDAIMSDNGNVKLSDFDKTVAEAVAIDAKYEGYLQKQQRLVAHFRNLEGMKIPMDLDYSKIEHLRTEAKEKLSAFQPATLAQASRISGITPADITVIQIHLKKYYSG